MYSDEQYIEGEPWLDEEDDDGDDPSLDGSDHEIHSIDFDF